MLAVSSLLYCLTTVTKVEKEHLPFSKSFNTVPLLFLSYPVSLSVTESVVFTQSMTLCLNAASKGVNIYVAAHPPTLSFTAEPARRCREIHPHNKSSVVICC